MGALKDLLLRAALEDSVQQGSGSAEDCPSCGYRGAYRPSLGQCFACYDRAGIERALRRRGETPLPQQVETPLDRVLKADGARAFWSHTVPTAGTLAEIYWLARGLTLPMPPSLRFLRRDKPPYRPDDDWFPCLVAAVQFSGSDDVAAVSRTYLARDGAAKAIQERFFKGNVMGGAVRLAPAAEEMLVGEGIETTASAVRLYGLPGWAALSTGGLRKLILPPLPLARSVLIAADNDMNGQGYDAARRARERWKEEGRAVRIAMPKKCGTDFNDVLREQDDEQE